MSEETESEVKNSNENTENIDNSNSQEASRETTQKNNDKKDEKEESITKSFFRELFEWVVCIVIAFFLAVLIKYFVFTPTLVMQNSMYPTIFDGERVFVNRLVRTFRIPVNRGDIITLEAPSGSISSGDVVATYYNQKGIKWFTYQFLEIGKISYIKRVIGVAGDKIKIEDGKVYLNGNLLNESSYLPDGTETYINDTFYHIKSEFVVPEGYVFAMGDNRSFSRDCRELGCIPVEKIEGAVVGRIWPLSKFGAIEKSDISKEEVDKHNDELNSWSL